MLRRVLFLALAIAVLPGCGTVSKIKGMFGSNNPSKALNEPAELVEIVPAVTVNRLWSTGMGEGEGKLWLRMRPTLDGNRLYAVDDDGVLRAIDAGSGDTVWVAQAIEVKTAREMKNLWLRRDRKSVV